MPRSGSLLGVGLRATAALISPSGAGKADGPADGTGDEHGGSQGSCGTDGGATAAHARVEEASKEV